MTSRDIPWTLIRDDFDLERVRSERRESVAVIVPAKNEAATIGAVIDAVTHHEGIVDEVLVVNDHSSDDTHAVASHHGARVLELQRARARRRGHIDRAGDHAVRMDVA